MKNISKNLIPILFLLVLSASLAGNVYLSRVVRSDHIPVVSAITEAKTHQQVGALSVAEADGRELKIALPGDQPTILYIFSPSCPWCAKNLSNIRALSIEEQGHYRFIGLSVGHHNLKDYLAKNPLPFPAYESLSDSDLKLLDFQGTPQTILLTESGTVEHNWRGAFLGGADDPVRKYFVAHTASRNDPGTRDVVALRAAYVER